MDNDRFGPNTEAIEVIVERIKRMTVDEAEALAASWYRGINAAGKTSGSAAGRAARNAAEDAARKAARDTLAAEWDFVWYAVKNAAKNAEWVAEWGGAREAAWEAALALLVKDQITPKQFGWLYGPWASVMDKETK